MKISINKESAVPIRDQLIEQLAVQIASGILKNKEKLPSIRALAQRLGIHYSTVTAAYNHLADAGLLEIRQGSGVRVSGRSNVSNTQGNQPLETLLNEFLARVAEQGYSKAELNIALKKYEKLSSVKRILVVDSNADFHPILLAELKPHFEIPVETCTIEELKTQNHEDALIVTSLYHVSAFQDSLTDLTRLVVCNVEPGGVEIGAATALPSGKLVLLVSVSQTMFKIASKLIASVRGEEIPIRTVTPSDTTELNYMMKHADLILCDSSSQAVVEPIAGKTRVLKFKLYSDTTLDLIKDRVSKWG